MARANHVEIQVVQQLNSAWPDEVPASFVSREGHLVDECDSRAASGQDERGDAPGGS
jgi:hypothetical protein